MPLTGLPVQQYNALSKLSSQVTGEDCPPTLPRKTIQQLKQVKWSSTATVIPLFRLVMGVWTVFMFHNL